MGLRFGAIRLKTFGGNAGAVIIRVASGGILYYNCNNEPTNPILMVLAVSTTKRLETSVVN